MELDSESGEIPVLTRNGIVRSFLILQHRLAPRPNSIVILKDSYNLFSSLMSPSEKVVSHTQGGDQIMNENQNSPAKLLIFGLGGVLVLTGIAFSFLNQPKQETELRQTAMVTTEAVNQVVDENVQGQVAAETETVIRYEGVEGQTVLETLKIQEDVVTQDSSFGEYVESINGLVGGEDGKYWVFYIDNEMAQIGAADYVMSEGEVIEWRFE